MTRRLLALALLGAAAVAAPAHASEISVDNPADGCTYTVWGPDITIYPGPPWPFGLGISGGFGERVECP